MGPEFLGIGSQRSGSTWLFTHLNAHPDIWMPHIKELHYFDEQQIDVHTNILNRLFNNHIYNHSWKIFLKRELKHFCCNPSIGKLSWDFRYFFGKRSDRWYLSLFQGKERSVCGEITPAYAVLPPEGIAHVHRLLPSVKIIILLRNPIERAWSHAKMDFALFEKRSISSVTDEEFIDHFHSERSLKRGHYLQILKNWKEYFPQEHIFIGFFDDILIQPKVLLEKLYTFLGVDPSFSEKFYVANPLHTQKSYIPDQLYKELARIYAPELERLHEQFGGYASDWLNVLKSFS